MANPANEPRRVCCPFTVSINVPVMAMRAFRRSLLQRIDMDRGPASGPNSNERRNALIDRADPTGPSYRPNRSSHSFSFDHLRLVCFPLTAIAIAFFWPTITTRRLPLVTAV
jgi:hypothetical protein